MGNNQMRRHRVRAEEDAIEGRFDRPSFSIYTRMREPFVSRVSSPQYSRGQFFKEAFVRDCCQTLLSFRKRQLLGVPLILSSHRETSCIAGRVVASVHSRNSDQDQGVHD